MAAFCGLHQEMLTRNFTQLAFLYFRKRPLHETSNLLQLCLKMDKVEYHCDSGVLGQVFSVITLQGSDEKVVAEWNKWWQLEASHLKVQTATKLSRQSLFLTPQTNKQTNKQKYVYEDWILNYLHNVVSSSKTLECSLPVFVVITLPVAEIQRFFLCA